MALILKIISEDYHKNITDNDQESNVQLSTSTYIDCMVSRFSFIVKIIGFPSLAVGALRTSDAT